ncbi:MOSC N-terminal beta barrel domain-containing protein [Burkholderiaceae bacterium UC74_6]
MHGAAPIVVAALYLHPIKACAPLAVSRLDFLPDGRVDGDREWAVLNDEGVASWQGAYPALALLQPRFEGDELVLSAPQQGELRLSRRLSDRPGRAGFWNEKTSSVDWFDAFDAGDEAAAMLTRLCAAPLRLARVSEAAILRPLNNAVHVVGRPSVQEIDAALDLRRFRANVVLDGPELLPFMEENATALSWDGGRIELYAPCVRCIVPDVDPLTAEVDTSVGQRVAAASAQRKPGGPSCFGVYGRLQAGTSLVTGAAVGLELDF